MPISANRDEARHEAPLVPMLIPRFVADTCSPDTPRRRLPATVSSRPEHDGLDSTVSPLTRALPYIQGLSLSHSTSLATTTYDSFPPPTSTSLFPRKLDFVRMSEKREPSLDYHDTLTTPARPTPTGPRTGAAHASRAEPRTSTDSATSASSASLVLENLKHQRSQGKSRRPVAYRDDDSDVEEEPLVWKGENPKQMTRSLKTAVWIISFIAILGWLLALGGFLTVGIYAKSSPSKATPTFNHEQPIQRPGSGKQISLQHVQTGSFRPHHAQLRWTPGPAGEDGLLMEINQPNKDFLVVEDVRSRKNTQGAHPARTLMKSGWLQTSQGQLYAENYWPSPDFKKVLILTRRQRVFRHSFTGVYWILDVASQTVEPLYPGNDGARVQLAQWAPTSDSIVFTMENNLHLRLLSSNAVRQITKDGGPEYFYGIPDWVYEEEVLQTNTGTWISRDGQYVGLIRTNETMVPEYPVQFFISRPSGKRPAPGLTRYPEVEQIKYPKVGAPNPVVDMMFYDVSRNEISTIPIDGAFPQDDRIVADVMWADAGKCLIRQMNRESDKLRVVMVDVPHRVSKLVRSLDVTALDNGWVEPGISMKYVPADPAKGRPNDGYLDTVYHNNYHHIGYFTPIDNPEPILLTSGNWSIENGNYHLDAANNLVYFTAAKQSPGERHVYSVDLKGQSIKPIVDTTKPGYFKAEFSDKAGYALISKMGPEIPTQEVISMPINPVKYQEQVTDNADLAKSVSQFELDQKIYSTIEVDGFTLQVLERRPPHFDPSKKYPVLFFQYSGPGSQQVKREFKVDFQDYVAATLGYIVVTVDPRGTGFSGRRHQCITRGQIGHYEAHDHIAAAKMWAQKPYVDGERMAIWGWSFGGFTTLKVLETDAGQTFKYGIAVAPVTDWRFYDSVYSERYMLTPAHNDAGYDRSSITNVTALSSNVRFMMMHGVADDNVHMQNTLTLLDKLDQAAITNYDVHFFPDSNHNIAFHGANTIVYEKIEKWLVSAFNGMWYKYQNPVPERRR